MSYEPYPPREDHLPPPESSRSSTPHPNHNRNVEENLENENSTHRGPGSFKMGSFPRHQNTMVKPPDSLRTPSHSRGNSRTHQLDERDRLPHRGSTLDGNVNVGKRPHAKTHYTKRPDAKTVKKTTSSEALPHNIRSQTIKKKSPTIHPSSSVPTQWTPYSTTKKGRLGSPTRHNRTKKTPSDSG